VLQCGAVWCSMLQCVVMCQSASLLIYGTCVAVRCCVLYLCVAVCCSVLQCAAVCCSVLQCVAVCCSVSVSQCVAVCCSVLQCAAVCRSVLQNGTLCVCAKCLCERMLNEINGA